MITNNVIVWASIGIIGLLLIIFLIFSYLMMKRKHEEKRNRLVNDYIQLYEKNWYDYLLKDGEIDSAVHDQKYQGFLQQAIDRILITYSTTISNQEVHSQVSKYVALNMKKYYSEMFKSKVWANRINVLRRTLLFNLEFLLPNIEDDLRKNKVKSKEEYILILRIVAKYNPNLFLAHLYKPRIRLTEYDYKVILTQIDTHYHEQFMRDFEELPNYLRLSLLDFLSLNSNLNYTTLLFYEGLLNSIYKEIRIRALKAISSFGLISDIQIYQQFSKSEEWEERLMLAKIIRFVDEADAYPLLHQLIRDPDWHVRKQAALTMKHKIHGEQELARIAEQTEDVYAAHMAKEILMVR